ncbi:polycomb group protein EMBRYONIC FLOWER 2-like [Bidens hawaiensis]|uniref:polycomb group protein EMBRYONIC FLOWER 2-like n=1 Tax=Bidens hawaiensis TaxID=980011 RepID=UPI00404B8152
MPGINLFSRQTMNCSRGSSLSRQREPRAQLTEEEQIAAEESLTVYCRPVEFYNILQRRAIRNPLFLQRCLSYKLKAKKRIQLSVSISGAVNDGLHTQNLFPFYIILARPLSTTNMERSAAYHFSKASKLTAFNGAETASFAQAKFILPDIDNLSAEIKSGSLVMLLVSCADITSRPEIDLTKEDNFSSLSNTGSYCLLGQIPMDLHHFERSTNLILRERAEMMVNVSMRSCYMKLSALDNEKCVSFQFPHNSEAVSILQQVPVIVFAEEIRAKEGASAYDLPDYSLPRNMRLKTGNVFFNYKYYNNMLQRTEVTEDFSCPFCLVRCASYKGVKFHLTSSHDLFHYDWDDYYVVNVSVKTDEFNSMIAGNGINPKKDTFSFGHTRLRIQDNSQTQDANDAHPLLLESDGTKGNTNSPITGTSSGMTEPDTVQSVPPMLQCTKTTKCSVEKSDPKMYGFFLFFLLQAVNFYREQLQKKQFFHSRKAQPMALEQVFEEHDSEDEVDHDVADLEDKRMLDDFLDVTSDEKHMMHLWNSFIRKQRVLADSHVPWACEAFSKLHGPLFVQNPALTWCWKLFMIKLWNHGLLDPKAMNNCSVILENYKKIHPATTQV